jgi:hypothetical protein
MHLVDELALRVVLQLIGSLLTEFGHDREWRQRSGAIAVAIARACLPNLDASLDALRA